MTALVEHLLVAIGRPLVWAGQGARALFAVAWQTLVLILTGRIAWRSTIAQAYVIGNGSIGFITVTLGFLGLISVYQAALQIQQIVPDFTMLGAAFLSMLLREFAPTITGLMIATRVGSGIAAEIGSMTVTEQVDALRMCNADPVEYLIVPRTLACAVMMIMLTVYGATVAYFAGDGRF